MVAAVILFTPHLLHAASATLAWDRASSHTNLSAFVLKYGASSGSYTGTVNVATNITSATVNDLVSGVRYFFVVTAKNVAGLESDPSNEISYTPPTSAPNVLPTLNPLINLTVSEDSTQQSVALAGITAGIGDLLQILSVTATSSNPSLIPTPTITYANPNTSGTLRFTPAANGSGTATITVTVNDGQSESNATSQSFSVTVNAENDAPTLGTISDRSLTINAALQTVSLTGIGTGAPNETQTLSVTATSSNPELIPTPISSYTSPFTSGSLSFTPVANVSGTATITVTVNDGQTQNNTAMRSFTATVNGVVNQPPTLGAISNVTISEDAAQQTVTLTEIGSGSTNENQALTVTVVSSNPSLIPTPTITYASPNTSGTLRFTPAVNATGTATITVTVNDGGLVNNLLSRTFTVTVNPLNDVPTLSALSNLSLNVNAGQQTVSLAGISSGAANESQALTVTVASSNSGLIPTPTVAYTSPNATGSLQFTPISNLTGTATITVTVNDGQAQNNTVLRSFIVTVAVPSTQTIYVQAESGARVSPMTIGSDANAANGQYVFATLANQGTVSISFTAAQSANYAVWCRVLAPNNGQDSFYFRMDNGTEKIFATAPSSSWSTEWRWTKLNAAGGTRTFALSPGGHTLLFRCREAYSYLDALYITSDPSFTPPADTGLTLAAAASVDPSNASQEVDSIAPFISSLEVVRADARSITLGWQTDEPAIGRVDYGVSLSLTEAMPFESNYSTDHTVTVPRLQPGTEYLLRIHAVDAAGNVATTEMGMASTSRTMALSWSAEEGTLTSPLKIWSSREAIDEACVASTEGSGSIRFSIQIDERSDYTLWCRLRSPFHDTEPFRLLIDGEESEVLPSTGERTGFEWRWVPVNKRPLSLNAGLHELSVESLPAGVALDEFFLSNDPEQVPEEPQE